MKKVMVQLFIVSVAVISSIPAFAYGGAGY